MPFLLTDNVNFLILQYLKKSGFTHTAYIFATESGLENAKQISNTDADINLIDLVQRGVYFTELEKIAGQIVDQDENSSINSDDSPTSCVNIVKRTIEQIEQFISKNGSLLFTDTLGFIKSDSIHKLLFQKHNSKNLISDANIASVLINHDSLYSIPDTFGMVNDFCWNYNLNILLTGHTSGACVSWNYDNNSVANTGLGRNVWSPLFIFDDGKSLDSSEILTINYIPFCDGVIIGDVTGNIKIYPQSNSDKHVYHDFSTSVWLSQWSHYMPRYSSKYILFSAVDGQVAVRSGNLYANSIRLRNHNDSISDISWSKSGLVAMSSLDGSISITNIDFPENPTIFKPLKGELYNLCWSNINEYLACICWDSSIIIYSKEYCEAPYEIASHASDITSLLWIEIDYEDVLISTDIDANVCWHHYDEHFKKWKYDKITLNTTIITSTTYLHNHKQQMLIISCEKHLLVFIDANKKYIIKTYELPQNKDIIIMKVNQIQNLLASKLSDGRICIIDLNALLLS